LASAPSGFVKDFFPSFGVVAQTSSSPLSLSFIDAPTNPFSKLNLTASTSLNDPTVKLHPTYEGKIIQTTSSTSNTPTLVQRMDTQDPSGAGRTRSVLQKTAGSVSEAQVWWGEEVEKENLGNVKVSTVWGANTVILG